MKTPFSYVFKKLRSMEFHYLSKIKNIEKLRNKMLLFLSDKERKNIGNYLLEKYLNENIFIINKTSSKLRKENIVRELSRDITIMSEVFFPLKTVREAVEKCCKDKEFVSLINEISEDEKESLEIILAMHYPVIIELISNRENKSIHLKYESELINEAFFGLTEAVYKFDLDKNNKFITYAIPWIKYRIKLFIDKVVKNIDMQNGKKYNVIFKSEIFECENFELCFNRFTKDIMDYDSPLPLAYIYPKLDFFKPSVIKSNLNMILSNYSYQKRIINHCKKYPFNEQCHEIIKKHPPSVAARLLLEEAFPYITKLKTSYYDEESEIFYNEQNYFSRDDSYKKVEQENMIEVIMRYATKDEKTLIKKFLREEINFKKIEPVILKIRKRMEEVGVLAS